MRIFNKDKSSVLFANEVDLEKGYLQYDKLLIAHHDAVERKVIKSAHAIAEEYRLQGKEVNLRDDGNWYVTTVLYDSGGNEEDPIKDVVQEAKDAYDEYEDIQVYIPYTAEELNQQRILSLKAELDKVKEDIEQETFGLIRNDYAEKKARAAEIINELRVLEGKEPREVNKL